MLGVGEQRPEDAFFFPPASGVSFLGVRASSRDEPSQQARWVVELRSGAHLSSSWALLNKRGIRRLPIQIAGEGWRRRGGGREEGGRLTCRAEVPACNMIEYHNTIQKQVMRLNTLGWFVIVCQCDKLPGGGGGHSTYTATGPESPHVIYETERERVWLWFGTSALLL